MCAPRLHTLRVRPAFFCAACPTLLGSGPSHTMTPKLARAWLLSLCMFVTASVSSVVHAAPCALGKPCPRAMNAETARGLALGTGSRASALSTSALAYNPAALVLGHIYHVEAG